MNDGVVSMGARVEVTKRLRRAYRGASKKEKSRVLDSFCESTGLSRATARRYLTSDVTGNPGVVRIDYRKARATKYSTVAKRILQRVWVLSGCQCGKYLAVSMRVWLDSLETHEELVIGRAGYSQKIRDELLGMSASTIDRYLKEARQSLELRGISATKPGALLRNSIKIRKAGDEIADEPGFFEMDTVAHCGPSLKGELVRTLTLTDVNTGWIHLEALQNNARVHMLKALDSEIETIPYQVQGLDCDNGSEFINREVINWASSLDVFFTRSRPYKKNDQAHVESKNNHVVRKYGFHYRYDTPEELKVLRKLWKTVCLRMNLFTPTRKPIGWNQDSVGRRKRVYDTPATPLDRLLASGILSRTQIKELQQLRDSTNPAELTRDILRYQAILTDLARTPTEVLTINMEQNHAKHKALLTQGIKTRSA
ncbi:integrase catalytic domain-containing protein [Mobiluncus curtisii]|uniref:integrase catalytic domain-containing protein n=1 Tax=Mobiluncus curtisii TaxID=2051 RepID=UPI001B8D8373|nr:DDE-type integrase/transposase/recombinase [Mobiluncus curtisii]